MLCNAILRLAHDNIFILLLHFSWYFVECRCANTYRLFYFILFSGKCRFVSSIRSAVIRLYRMRSIICAHCTMQDGNSNPLISSHLLFYLFLYEIFADKIISYKSSLERSLELWSYLISRIIFSFFLIPDKIKDFKSFYHFIVANVERDEISVISDYYCSLLPDLDVSIDSRCILTVQLINLYH